MTFYMNKNIARLNQTWWFRIANDYFLLFDLKLFAACLGVLRLKYQDTPQNPKNQHLSWWRLIVLLPVFSSWFFSTVCFEFAIWIPYQRLDCIELYSVFSW